MSPTLSRAEALARWMTEQESTTPEVQPPSGKRPRIRVHGKKPKDAGGAAETARNGASAAVEAKPKRPRVRPGNMDTVKKNVESPTVPTSADKANGKANGKVADWDEENPDGTYDVTFTKGPNKGKTVKDGKWRIVAGNAVLIAPDGTAYGLPKEVRKALVGGEDAEADATVDLDDAPAEVKEKTQSKQDQREAVRRAISRDQLETLRNLLELVASKKAPPPAAHESPTNRKTILGALAHAVKKIGKTLWRALRGGVRVGHKVVRASKAGVKHAVKSIDKYDRKVSRDLSSWFDDFDTFKTAARARAAAGLGRVHRAAKRAYLLGRRFVHHSDVIRDLERGKDALKERFDGVLATLSGKKKEAMERLKEATFSSHARMRKAIEELKAETAQAEKKKKEALQDLQQTVIEAKAQSQVDNTPRPEESPAQRDERRAREFEAAKQKVADTMARNAQRRKERAAAKTESRRVRTSRVHATYSARWL